MSGTFPADPESVFTYGAPQLKFGVGAADEIGFDLSQYGVRRVLVVTDAGVAATGAPQRIADQMGQFGILVNSLNPDRIDGQRSVVVRHPAAGVRRRPCRADR